MFGGLGVIFLCSESRPQSYWKTQRTSFMKILSLFLSIPVFKYKFAVVGDNLRS